MKLNFKSLDNFKRCWLADVLEMFTKTRPGTHFSFNHITRRNIYPANVYFKGVRVIPILLQGASAGSVMTFTETRHILQPAEIPSHKLKIEFDKARGYYCKINNEAQVTKKKKKILFKY